MHGMKLTLALAGLCAGAACGAGVKISERFGYDPHDATRFLQAALDSGLPEIIVDAKPGPWFAARTLKGRSNQTIRFEEGAWLRARRGCFKGANDALLRFHCCSNVAVRGAGPRACGLRMWRADYDDPAQYAHSEWRHGIALLSCVGVRLEGIHVAETGGDGLYVSTAGGSVGAARAGCRDVVVKNCIFDRNYRQGISVIGVDGFLVEDVELTNTRGTPPESGIDFEPNAPWECLRNIVMRRCLVQGNHGKGLDVSHCNSGAVTPPNSILFEDCRVIDNAYGFIYGTGAHDADVAVDAGEITLRNCLLKDCRGTAIAVSKRINCGGVVTFENCTIENCGIDKPARPDVELSVTGHSSGAPDRVVFRNVRVTRPVERPLVSWTKRAEPYRGVPTVIEGAIRCVTAGREEVATFDAAWRAKNFPFVPYVLPPPISSVAAPLEGDVVVDEAPGRSVPCAPVFLRARGRWLVFHAAQPGDVSLTLQQMPVGRNGYDRAKDVEVFARGSKTRVAKLPVPRGPEPAETVFKVPAAGFYDVAVATGGNGLAVVASSVPIALDATAGAVPLIGANALPAVRKYREIRPRLYFHVPEGSCFECGFTAEGGETIAAEVFDPADKSVWRVPYVDGFERVQPRPSAGLWSMALGKPSTGCYEDHAVVVRGVPGWLFLSNEKHWRR